MTILRTGQNGVARRLLQDDYAALKASQQAYTVGDIITTRKEGFAYEVVDADEHLTTAGGTKLKVLPGPLGYNGKAFGATGDGATDDTAAIQAALDAAAADGVDSVILPAGTYMHTGIDVPRGVTFRGASIGSTILYMIAGTNPAYNVKLMSSRACISDLTIFGNRDNNTTGIGIDADRTVEEGNAAACFVTDVEVKNCPQEGIIFTNGNLAHLLNVSVTRCTTCLVVSRSTQFTMTNVDLAKFTVAGLHMLGSPAQNVVIWNGGFTEAAVDTPATAAPFFHLESMRRADSLVVKGVWVNGHLSDLGYDMVGVHIEDPLYADNISFEGVVFSSVKTAAQYTGVATDEIGTVDLRGISIADGGGEFTRQHGALTQDSYHFDVFTNEKTLSSNTTTTEYIVPEGGPLQIDELSMLVTEAFAGTGDGALNFGTEADVDHFVASTPLTNGLAVNDVVDMTGLLDKTRTTNHAFERIILRAITPLSTSGKARFRLRGTVY